MQNPSKLRTCPPTTPPSTEISFKGTAKTHELGANNIGSGLWYQENNAQNTVIRTKCEDPSVEAGELIAILWATQEEPADRPLHVIGSSKEVIRGLTTQLKDH